MGAALLPSIPVVGSFATLGWVAIRAIRALNRGEDRRLREARGERVDPDDTPAGDWRRR